MDAPSDEPLGYPQLRCGATELNLLAIRKKAVTYPYELLCVPGTEALKTLADLRIKGKGIPIILGNQETYERIVECMELNDEATPAELIKVARSIDVIKWFKDREAADPEYYDIESAPWPNDSESPNTALSAHRDVLSQEPYSQVFITILPTEESWEAPCFLKIGNWNSVPKAEEHAAIFKYWSDKYGATVACIADDVIEMTVERPASTREDALLLARQQYIYCADIVDQGVESIEALAATLLGATVWYFWWD